MAFGSSEPRKGRPRLCRACGNLIGADSDECSFCGAKDRLTAGLLQDPMRLFGALGPWRALVAANVIYFAVMAVAFLLTADEDSRRMVDFFGIPGLYDTRTFVLFGGLSPRLVIAGDYWRLVTPIFIHLGLVHLAMNSFALITLGPTAEDLFGRSKLFVIYMAAGIAGFAASVLRGIGGGGASGAIFGLLGAMLAYALRTRSHTADLLRGYVVQWVVYAVILAFMWPVNNTAHAVGFASGFAIAWLLGPGEPVRRSEERIVTSAAWGALLATAASFAMAVVTVASWALPSGQD
jgi:membrane associated rhomboid family serine protease